MPKGRKQDPNTALTRSEKHRLRRMLLDLTFYLETPGGSDMLERLEQLSTRIHAREKLSRIELLTTQQARALKFIQAELRKGHSPTCEKSRRLLESGRLELIIELCSAFNKKV
jgi:hypothetical protein